VGGGPGSQNAPLPSIDLWHMWYPVTLSGWCGPMPPRPPEFLDLLNKNSWCRPLILGIGNLFTCFSCDACVIRALINVYLFTYSSELGMRGLCPVAHRNAVLNVYCIENKPGIEVMHKQNRKRVSTRHVYCIFPPEKITGPPNYPKIGVS